MIGETGLMNAAFHGHIQVVKFLLSNGSSVQEKTNTGNYDKCLLLASLHVIVILLINNHSIKF